MDPIFKNVALVGAGAIAGGVFAKALENTSSMSNKTPETTPAPAPVAQTPPAAAPAQPKS
jgi:hypothetical protein